MKNITSQLQDSFKGLNFNEEEHKYLLTTSTCKDMSLISTTTFLKRYDEAFNSFIISSMKAKKHLKVNAEDPRTAQYYRQRWKLLGQSAADSGTRVHNFAECYPHFDIPYDWKEQGVIDFFDNLPSNYIVVAKELKVYDEDTEHAGTIDLILYNKDTGKLVVADWKTNKRNIFEQYKNKKMKGVFKHMRNITFNKFTLQLSDYANMINKNTEFEVEDCWVIWLKEGNITTPDFDRHNNNDYTIHAETILDNQHYYKTFKINMVCETMEKEYQKYKIEKNTPKRPIFSTKK